MSTIVTRAGKGSALTWTEADANFTNLNTDKAELSGATFTGQIISTAAVPAFYATVASSGLKLSSGTAYYDVGTAHVINGGATTAAMQWYFNSAGPKMALSSIGNLTLDGLTASRALATDASKGLVSSATTATELGYVNGVTSAIQTQLDAITTAASNLAIGRNRIINGGMRLDQRNSGVAVSIASAAYTYTLDRWAAFGQAADGVFSVQQLTTGTPPTGFTHYLRAKTTTADASVGSAQYYFLTQRIEGVNVGDLDLGLSTARTVTLSFWIRSSLTGAFGGSLRNSAGSRSYPFTYTINAANTWEQKTITIAGDITGTWLTDTGVGVGVSFDLGCGSANIGTANAWAASDLYGVTGGTKLISTLNATWDLTGVQFEVGSVASQFERRQFTTEQQLCERYFQWGPDSFTGFCPTTALARCSWPFRTPMRSTPTIVNTSLVGNVNAVGVNSAITGTSIAVVAGFGCTLDVAPTGTPLTAGQGVSVTRTSGTLAVVAEL